MTERGGRIPSGYATERFAEYRDELGPPGELSPHALRHSSVMHLVEDGFDELLVQMQVGHRHASTTGLYIGVSGATTPIASLPGSPARSPSCQKARTASTYGHSRRARSSTTYIDLLAA